MTLFIVLIIVGLVAYFALRGRKDRREQLGASARPMGSGPIAPQTFACPHPKCPSCGAAGNGMKQQWDGFRKVSWSCSYCGWTGVQELKDEELPPSVRQRLGGHRDHDDYDDARGFQGGPGAMGGMGSGMGGLMTGMMLGSMMGGSSSGQNQGDGWGSDSSDSSSGDDGGWGSSDGGSDWGGGGDDFGGGGDDW